MDKTIEYRGRKLTIIKGPHKDQYGMNAGQVGRASR